MRNIVDQTLPLNSYTVEEWEKILEHGSFRGYNIQRFKRKFEKNPDSIGFNPEISTLTYSKNGEVKLEIPLYKIRKCKTPWSASRFIYWIKTTLFCADKTDVTKLAEFIHEKVQLNKRDKLDEKAKWKEHKAAMNFSTRSEMKKVISPEVYGRIRSTGVTSKHKVLLGKAHQVKELYKDTHYTFIHGQSLSYWVINQLIKELEKLKQPEQTFSLYHFLRLPDQELKTTRKEHINRSFWNSEYDDFLGDELLSVDGHFFHNYSSESANSFISSNSNIQLTNQNKIIEDILNHYSIYSLDLFEKLTQLCSEFKALETIGHLYTISIPKHRVNDLVYTAHAFGVACDCADKKALLKKLDDHQKNIPYDCEALHLGIPQYRILTHLLNPEEMIITLQTPVSKEKKDEFKGIIRDSIRDVYLANHS